jgi:hypothetical protein
MGEVLAMPRSNKCCDLYVKVNNTDLEQKVTQIACKEIFDIESLARQFLHEIILKMERENQ